GFSFECVPLVETAVRRQEFLETRVGSPVPEETFDAFVPIGQLFFGKTQRKAAPQVKVILVWYRDVSIRCLKIGRNIFFVDWTRLRDPVDRVGLKSSVRLVPHPRRTADEVRSRR